jgi:hypothetical protein
MTKTLSNTHPPSDSKITIGWQEWCRLPLIGIPRIKAKIDTGAKTSALHAFNIRIKTEHGHKVVHFSVHPSQGETKHTVECHAPLVDRRYIMSSNGHRELRYVIRTEVHLGPISWPIDLTLSRRDPLKFRMLLGREAMQHHVIIDPARKLLQPLKRKIVKRKLKRISHHTSHIHTETDAMD